MKNKVYLVAVALLIVSCNNGGQQKASKNKFSEYHLAIPKKWTTERIPFPIEFAPQIAYKGFEDLRFPPGWQYTTSEEHWSYAFLWWLNGKPKIDAETLQKNLLTYYTGLIRTNIDEKKISKEKLTLVKVTIQNVQAEKGDMETYNGIISIPDYLDLNYKAINLNCIIHKKDCNTHTAILFEISPQSLGDAIWQQLNKIEEDFDCKN